MSSFVLLMIVGVHRGRANESCRLSGRSAANDATREDTVATSRLLLPMSFSIFHVVVIVVPVIALPCVAWKGKAQVLRHNQGLALELLLRERRSDSWIPLTLTEGHICRFAKTV